MRADRLSHPVKTSKEVSMTKRLLHRRGRRRGTSRAGGPRHGLERLPRGLHDHRRVRGATTASPASRPCSRVGGDQARRGRARRVRPLRLPYGSVCQGCHTSNFDPAKVVPTPTATSASRRPSPGRRQRHPDRGPGRRLGASSENYVGCSSCHYGIGCGRSSPTVQTRTTRHTASRYGEMANADICGAVPLALLVHGRHLRGDADPVREDRRRGESDPQPVADDPDPAADGARRVPDARSPAPAPATGWDPAAPLSDYLNVRPPGWTPDSGSGRYLGRLRQALRRTGRTSTAST